MTRLEFEMNERGLKDATIAVAIEKSPDTVRNYRTGATKPPTDIAKKIGEFFPEIPTLDLFEEYEVAANA
jgi:DNA-binding XRE family transcriptional regulator